MRLSMFLKRHQLNATDTLTDHLAKGKRRSRAEAGLGTTELVIITLSLVALAVLVFVFLGDYVQSKLDQLP